MGPIIAVLLALTMAIFPISMPQAAALNGPEQAMMLDAHHTHDEASLSCDDAPAVSCGDHESSDHGASNPSCCGMGMCHAFQVSAVPGVHSPPLSAAPIAIVGDEQVESLISGRLDRPPSTV